MNVGFLPTNKEDGDCHLLYELLTACFSPQVSQGVMVMLLFTVNECQPKADKIESPAYAGLSIHTF